MMPRMVANQDYDIPYAYELFNRITASATVDGKALGAILLDDRYNLWHCFAQSAFMDDCVAFSRTKRFADVADGYRSAHGGGMSLSYFLMGGIAFLITLVAWLKIRFGKKRVLIYSVDRATGTYHADFRIERIYRELEARHVPYTEVFHTIIGRGFWQNLIARRRAAVYLEGIEWLFYLVRMLKRAGVGRAAALTVAGLENFTNDERLFAEALIQKYVSVAPLLRFRTDYLTHILTGSSVATALSIDDMRHDHEIMIAARRANIASYAFQHGQFTPYHIGWIATEAYHGEYARADRLVVWNEYWRNELIALNAVWSADRIDVGGSPKDLTALKIMHSADSPLVLIPYEIHAPTETLKRFLESLKACGMEPVIKLRPDKSTSGQLERFGDVGKDIRTVTDLADLHEPVACVAGTSSTFLYDAAGSGVPVGLVVTPLKYAKRMVENGLADAVPPGDPCSALKRLAALPESEIAGRQSVLAPADYFADTIGSILKSVHLI